MTLTFLGTRGNIDIRSRRHRRHTSTLVAWRRARILIDCGGDWLGAIGRLRPTAIVVTHAHTDHVDGLRRGAPCPVYASDRAWARMGRWPIRQIERISPRKSVNIGGLAFEPFPVGHSVGTPAVGYRITCGWHTIFYVPDVFKIPHVREALEGIALYVGDGATVTRPIVRRRHEVPIGHNSIAAQLRWCALAHVPRAIFTHCGSGIVRGGRAVERRVQELGSAIGVDAEVAYDGLRITIP